MPLSSRNHLPPSGWIYTQLDANKKPLKSFASMAPFRDAAQEILDFRKGNNLPRATLQETEEDLDEAQCQRLGYDPQWVSSQKKNPSMLKRFEASSSHLLAGVKAAAGSIVTGASILADWLGSGGRPVAQELAQSRANTCIPCPKNKEGHGATKLTAAVANAILVQRRQKMEMNLTVEGEDNLHSCSVCLCHIPLLIWTPTDVIAGRTGINTLHEYPDFCWKRKELEAFEKARLHGLQTRQPAGIATE